MYPPGEKRFLIVNRIAIMALFAVILAGGVVRSSGSGMGCPDWPKCFNQYVPPTSASQLPEGYKEHYVSKRVAKNERFANMLDALGYTKLADRIRHDESILQPEDFNAVKTWTEYVNRVIGVLSGLALLGCALFSVTYLKSRKRIFFLSVVNLVAVGFQGWLGSIVVSTNLLAWIVTVHMLLALVILAISIYTYYQARILRNRMLLSIKNVKWAKGLAIIALLLTIVQITIGTEVREGVDAIASAMGYVNRGEWLSQVGSVFNTHRDMALLVLVINGALFFIIRSNYSPSGERFRYVTYTAALIVLQVISGIILSYWALPAVAQTVHLVLATLLFGAQFYLILILSRKRLYSRKLA
ncbi:heme A synthase (plasmid) [Pedobacter sp. BS3]|nr:heme A synthase [Pedobacter sp. BS3]